MNVVLANVRDVPACRLVDLTQVEELALSDVGAQLELLTQQVHERIRNPESPGSEIDYMTQGELLLRQTLLDKLPSAAQERENAAARVQQRILARRRKP